jgi:hypothetical protein
VVVACGFSRLLRGHPSAVVTPPVETGGWNFGKSAFADCGLGGRATSPTPHRDQPRAVCEASCGCSLRLQPPLRISADRAPRPTSRRPASRSLRGFSSLLLRLQPPVHIPADRLHTSRNPVLSYFRTFAPSHLRTFAPSHLRTFALSHFRTFALSHFRTFALSHFRTFALSHFHTSVPGRVRRRGAEPGCARRRARYRRAQRRRACYGQTAALRSPGPPGAHPSRPTTWFWDTSEYIATRSWQILASGRTISSKPHGLRARLLHPRVAATIRITKRGRSC